MTRVQAIKFTALRVHLGAFATSNLPEVVFLRFEDPSILSYPLSGRRPQSRATLYYSKVFTTRPEGPNFKPEVSNNSLSRFLLAIKPFHPLHVDYV